MEAVALSSQDFASISGVQEPVIYNYFQRLNAGDFVGVAQLFSPQGCLYAPFAKGVCGREAILHYLQAEAIDLKALPKSGQTQTDLDGITTYQITGQVQTNYFTVNVAWSIQLDESSAIVLIDIKLLAELQDLLGLKRP